MGKRSAVVELFLGDMGSIQRELRPSIQREDQLTMETKLEQITAKAVNQLPKSVVREIRTPRSVGAGGGRPPPATRWDGKRSVAEWPKLPRPSSTLPFRTGDRRRPPQSAIQQCPSFFFVGDRTDSLLKAGISCARDRAGLRNGARFDQWPTSPGPQPSQVSHGPQSSVYSSSLGVS